MFKQFIYATDEEMRERFAEQFFMFDQKRESSQAMST